MNLDKELKKSAGIEVRLVALRLLSSVIDKKISLDGLTDRVGGQTRYLALSERDRTLARAIAVTSLRHHDTIASAITRFIKHPLPLKARSLRHLIHMTAAQILYLQVPDYASINLAVTIAKSDSRLRRFAPLVNAVTRQVARQAQEILAKPDEINHASSWFLDMLEAAYGKIKARAIIKAQSHEPPLDLTVKEDAQGWAEKLSGQWFKGSTTVRLTTALGKNITQLPGFATGDWWVQDIAASLPARLMGDVSGKKLADLCAAPGGKTAQLALLGADVRAFDSSPSRLQRLVENMQRLNLDITTHCCDVRHFQPAQLFDAVLCDAPCSSTGTVRRHPDILWTKSLADIDRLAKLQATLLEAALTFTKPGGMVIFSNCSLAPQEGERLIEHFLHQHPEIRLSPIKAGELPPKLDFLITPQGFLRSTPADLAEFGGMDGFFAARLIKN